MIYRAQRTHQFSLKWSDNSAVISHHSMQISKSLFIWNYFILRLATFNNSFRCVLLSFSEFCFCGGRKSLTTESCQRMLSIESRTWDRLFMNITVVCKKIAHVQKSDTMCKKMTPCAKKMTPCAKKKTPCAKKKDTMSFK